MAPLCCAAIFDPCLSLDCIRLEGRGMQSKERHQEQICHLATLATRLASEGHFFSARSTNAAVATQYKKVVNLPS